MSERNVVLEDVAELIRGVSYRPTDLLTDGTGAVPLLRATNIGNRTLELTNVLYVPSALVRDSQLLRRFDVVIAMSSGSRLAVGRLAQLRQDWLGCVGAFCAVIRPDPKGVHPEYLGYVLQSPEFRARIETHAVGTAIMNLSRERLFGFPLRLPELADQRAIAHILGTLDDKIALNRRMNETLEATARTIFKSWFVDYDPVRAKADGRDPGLSKLLADLFPDRFVDSELGEIPEGWTISALDTVADFVNGAACQKFLAEPGAASLPVIKIRELNQGVSDQSERVRLDFPPKHHAEDGDVLFSWSGTLTCKVWTGGPGFVNQHVFKVSSDRFARWFFLYWTNNHLDGFRGIAADKATTMGHIKRQHLSEARVVVPPDELLAAAQDVLGSLVDRQVNTELESRSLAALRDLLLPRLLSGELRLGGSERLIEASA